MNDITHVEPQALAVAEPSITSIIASAVQSGRPASELTELLAFARELDKDKARKAFNVAFAAFKAECPAIVRKTSDGNPKMSRVNADGVRVPRKYASLDDISSVIDPVLSKYGLSYSWSDATVTPEGLLTRAFILRHVEGHEKPTSSPPMPIEGTAAYAALCKDRGDSSASPQQRMGIADSYAMRYSMIAGLGLTTCDDDEDGARIGSEKTAGPTVTDAQAQQINDLLLDLADFRGIAQDQQIAAFKSGYKIGTISELPAAMFDTATKTIQTLMAKKK